MAHGHGLLRWVWIAGVILILYVLSVGPAAKITQRHVMLWNTFWYTYLPVHELRKRSTIVQRVYLWYVFDLWRCPGPVLTTPDPP